VLLYEMDKQGDVLETVWLSQWDGPLDAWRFARRAEERMASSFGAVPFGISRNGRLVAIAWPGGVRPGRGRLDYDRRAAQFAVGTCVTGVATGRVERLLLALNDMPWPIRLPSFEGYSSGFGLLGGHVLDIRVGQDFVWCNAADGLLCRFERNADRHYYGVGGGLVRHARDVRAGQTFWKVPLVASYFSRDDGDEKHLRWQVLWGLIASGDERSARVLFLPVWREVSK
jgi:hypothetical protein